MSGSARMKGVFAACLIGVGSAILFAADGGGGTGAANAPQAEANDGNVGKQASEAVAAANSEEEKSARPERKEDFRVFLLMGQSNMEGAGYPVLPDYLKPQPNVLMLNDQGEWVPDVVPFGRGMGPGDVFARRYAALHPDATIGVIHAARGGRSIRELSKGGRDNDGTPNYDRLIEKAKAAQKRGKIMGILWHQGETDAGAGEKYLDDLNKLFEDVRSDLGEPDLPAVAGELGRFASWTAGFNRVIAKAPERVRLCALASSEGLSDRGDELHFSGFSVEVLGARYLAAHLALREPELAAEFKDELVEIEREMLGRDAAWNVLENGSMSEGEARPLGWDARGWNPQFIRPASDRNVYASAPASLRVESIGAPGEDAVGTWLRNVRGRRIAVKCKMKNDGFERLVLRIRGENAGFRECLNHVLVDATDAKEWTEYSAEFDVPDEAMRDRLEVFAKGRGRAWLDDVSVEILEPRAPEETGAADDAATLEATKEFSRNSK